MKISYNWLKWYVPEAPSAEKLADVFTYHVAEVESVEKLMTAQGEDSIFEIKILPNRAHDLLSHHGIAKEIASLLNIEYKDPEPMYKVPKENQTKPTNLKIKVESDKCRRYMGRIVRNIKVGPSPDWVVGHLASIGQRSINNVVDAANITMFDCGQPVHCFDLDKLGGIVVARKAREGEHMTTLDNKIVKLSSADIVIADEKNVLGIAGVKGGKIAEVDNNTKNIMIEVANFDPIATRKTAKRAGIFTDAAKRFENDLSPEFCEFGMKEMTGLMVEIGATDFEDVVDIYPKKQEKRNLIFSTDKISNVLGLKLKDKEIEEILNRYHIDFKNSKGEFEINVPAMRLDLTIEEDMAEEIGRVLGYDKVKSEIPKIKFTPKANETYEKIVWARNKLLADGYSEVMTYTFSSKGEVQVLESASDKKFLRTNLSDGIKESLQLNKTNAPLLGMSEIKIFEIGTVFKNSGEEIHVAYNEKNQIKEINLKEFCESTSPDTFSRVLGKNPQTSSKKHADSAQEKFEMWSLFPFVARDVAVWVPEKVESSKVYKVIKENSGDVIVRGPELFDEFKKDGKISYAFRLVFQSNDRTLTDEEVNKIMDKIKEKITEKKGWQVR